MAEIIGNVISIDNSAVISDDAIIKANSIEIEKNVIIGKNFKAIVVGKLKIGFATVLNDTNISCRNITIGSNNWIVGVWIEGSKNSLKSDVKIGNENLILQHTRINCNDYVEIGNDIGIGQYVEIWTHGTFMDVMKGYPYIASPVKIGNHVWITAHSTVMPGVSIGNNIIIGNNSFVNKNVPDGCFFAGQPGEIIKENVYPPVFPQVSKEKILDDIIKDYLVLMKLKNIDSSIKRNSLIITINSQSANEVEFNVKDRTIKGTLDEYVEDFRDYLRYRGVKFFTDRPFKSIDEEGFLH